ncbi:glutamine--fructose-6-phosphate transaminase (isomerizing) [Fodinicurvata sp. EGI_FJ10296]|uniref:glutamine--fructose-6-phosphate transaminase (isomerizing) n=1 Tax=Fodinicurvata sp. EGI_FJ10296 TaxID=3231908 RepID=UPI0034518110
MCGIIGMLGKDDVADRLVEALQRLEYRGYDSAGISTLVDGRIDRRRSQGKLANLRELLARNPLSGRSGIGHTRWATHGRPCEINAHPHATKHVSLVHNGIIENYKPLRDELTALGHIFETETDTEVVVHLITRLLDGGCGPRDAAANALGRLDGAFALVMLFQGEDDLLIGARRGSPLAVGFGDGEMYLGSDAIALAPWTSDLIYLEDGDRVEVTRAGVVVFDGDGNEAARSMTRSAISSASVGKENYPHFMLKEIHEQPSVIGDGLRAYVDPGTRRIALPPIPVDWKSTPRITIVACGTAFYAAMTAKYWLERIAGIPVEIDIASEFRYRQAPMPTGGIAIFVSQSGETADTLAALRYARKSGQTVISIVNVPESSAARESDAFLRTLAGPEIGVASTKAFTTQLCVLACLAITAGRDRGVLSLPEERTLTDALIEIPSRVAEVLARSSQFEVLGQWMAAARDVMYLGRGTSFPLAMEGALKLKEISYIHAEGYPAGEMKHGPLALIDDNVPVVVLAPYDQVFEKTASNVQEVVARGGRIVAFTDGPGAAELGDVAARIVQMPTVHPFVAPILYALPMQLLAYYTAVAKGTDVDQPRNLAKSVTVE